jgi:hypothetical protein
MIATGAQMRDNPLTFEKDLDGARRQPHLDLAAGEAVGHAVEVRLGARRRLWWPLDDNYIGRLGFAEAEVINVPPAIAGGTLNVRQAGH